MEGMIASLLKDFEDGKMDRRQLIRSLAAVAMVGGTTAATTVAQAPAEKAPWKTVHLDHISYAVSDYRRSAAFYSSLMGWEVVNDNGANQATLRMGTIGDIIVRNARRPQEMSPNVDNGAGPLVSGVINHISFGIEPWDTDAVKAELDRRGLAPRPDMQGANYKSWHVLDPDGWDLQISNQTRLG